MASVNKVIIIGNLGKDPEARFTTNGTAVTNFTVATSEKYKNKSGEYEERTEWHNIQTFGRIAELAGQYLSKGKTVYIEGKLSTRKWQDKNGFDRYTTEIIANELKFISSRSESKPTTDSHTDNVPADDDIPF